MLILNLLITYEFDEGTKPKLKFINIKQLTYLSSLLWYINQLSDNSFDCLMNKQGLNWSISKSYVHINSINCLFQGYLRQRQKIKAKIHQHKPITLVF